MTRTTCLSCFQLMFITSLFYLLAGSDKNYLPVELFARITPIVSRVTSGDGSGNKLGKAVEEAVGCVT